MTTAAVATPSDRDVELVNGGYGIKHPLLRHSDVSTRNLINAQQLGQADTFKCYDHLHHQFIRSNAFPV